MSLLLYSYVINEVCIVQFFCFILLDLFMIEKIIYWIGILLKWTDVIIYLHNPVDELGKVKLSVILYFFFFFFNFMCIVVRKDEISKVFQVYLLEIYFNHFIKMRHSLWWKMLVGIWHTYWFIFTSSLIDTKLK